MGTVPIFGQRSHHVRACGLTEKTGLSPSPSVRRARGTVPCERLPVEIPPCPTIPTWATSPAPRYDSASFRFRFPPDGSQHNRFAVARPGIALDNQTQPRWGTPLSILVAGFARIQAVRVAPEFLRIRLRLGFSRFTILNGVSQQGEGATDRYSSNDPRSVCSSRLRIHERPSVQGGGIVLFAVGEKILLDLSCLADRNRATESIG